MLDNTYFIFTSDNGFHLGQHGLNYEKFTLYEEDVRVPFFIRGPGVPASVMTDYQITMVDVPTTILTLAGVYCLPDWQGRTASLPLVKEPWTESRNVRASCS